MNRTLLSLVVSVVLTGCATQIQHGLDERDANEIVSVLVERGFAAKKVAEKGKKPTWAIELSEGDATEAMRVLTELKLPRPQRLKTQTLAQATSLIDTPTAERLRQLEAQEGDIEESLETMDGVASAAVELVIPPPARPGQPQVASKASVLIRVRADAQERLNMQRGELRALVAGAVDGLKPDDVVLVIDVVSIPAPQSRPASADGNRLLVVSLGVTLSALAMLLVVLAWRLKRAPKQPVAAAPSPATTSQPARPVVNVQAPRKAA